MRHRFTALVSAGILLAALLAGCGQNAGSQPASDSAEPAATERVPVVDTQYEKILDGYDVVGSFHNGVAFAARYLVTPGEDYTMKGDLPPVECGYITLEGEYTPLYVVPNEIELLGPAEGRANLHGSVDDIFLNTEEGMELYFGGEASIQSAPSPVQQKALDDIFLVGDNGWVPYFENDKWGYCDLSGQVTLAPAYDFVEPFYNGKALVCNYEGGQYLWMMIDETGAQLAALEPTEMFALRQSGGEFIFLYDKTYGWMYRADGTSLAEYADMGCAYREQDGWALQQGGNVYDTEGLRCESEGAVLDAGVQDGCTAYQENDRYGIRGADGAVRVEARFAEICRLAPEGFYAREDSNQVNLYDYDGNLLQEAVPCVRVLESKDGYFLYDGKGQVLAEYHAQGALLAQYAMAGEKFLTEEGFVSLHLDDQEMVTVHITFEERTVEPTAAPDASASSEPAGSDGEFPEGASLNLEMGDTILVKKSSLDKRGQLTNLPPLSFVSWDFDSYNACDRSAILGTLQCSEGLEWYETMDHGIVVCDASFNTVYTVPQELLTQARGTPDGKFGIGSDQPLLTYVGDGLWSFHAAGYDTGVGIVVVFDREGNTILQMVGDGDNQGMVNALANEGYFSLVGNPDAFYTMEGEPVQIQPAGEATVNTTWMVFDGGLINTPYGYADEQGRVVLSADQLLETVRQYLQAGEDKRVDLKLDPFDGEQATLYVEISNLDYTDGEYKNVRIDRAGMVVDCQDGTWEDAQNVPYERGVEIKQQVYRALIRKPFLIQEQSGHTGETLLLPSGQPVSRPEGVQFGYGLVQCDDRYAFVEADTTGKEFFSNETEYVLVDAAGRVYTEWKQGWDYVYPVEGGTAYGVKTVYDGQGGVERYELTPLTVTVSRG